MGTLLAFLGVATMRHKPDRDGNEHHPTVTDVQGSVGVTKSVFAALAGVMPDDDHNYLTRAEIRHGWGNILNIRLHTTIPRSAEGREFGDRLRGAIDDALGDQRHSVEIVWEAPA